MKIMVVCPGILSPQEIEHRRKYLQPAASSETELKVVGIKSGPVSVKAGSDLSLLVPGILERTREAAEQRFDGLFVHCFNDPGIDAARDLVDIPVVGAGNATFRLACLLADKFCIISPFDELTPYVWRQVQLAGIKDRVTSIRAINIPVLEMIRRKDEMRERILKLTKRAIADEDAQLMIPGCLALLPAVGMGAREAFEKDLGVPVLDGSATALKTTEMLVDLKLSQSRKAFPRPKI
jgi:allantoin racemase